MQQSIDRCDSFQIAHSFAATHVTTPIWERKDIGGFLNQTHQVSPGKMRQNVLVVEEEFLAVAQGPE